MKELEQIEMLILLEGIYQYYGFDFRNYNRSSIHRRVKHRVAEEKLSSISALLDKVLHDPAALERLLSDFSISVTEMFRDPSFFSSFRTQVVPLLRNYSHIRIWLAGCSTGEEVFSLAILLHEEDLYQKTRIYATDMNGQSLEKAKQGRIMLKNMKHYTQNYLQAGGKAAFSEYYSVHHEHAVFHARLLENVLFAQHNLVTDRSFNEFHVILSRNVLIYFNKILQKRVVDLFYDSLITNGILGLGSKEELSDSEKERKFSILHAKEKLYCKV